MSRRRRRSPPRPLLVALCLVLFALGIVLGIQLAKPPPLPDLSTLEVSGDEGGDPPALEEYPEPPAEDPISATADEIGAGLFDGEIEVLRQPPRGGPPRVALIFDDLGRSVERVEDLAALGVPLTYSVLPFEARTPGVVAELHRRGVEVLCHLPMQALGDVDSGPGSLLASMSPEEIRRGTLRALEAVPGARGVNNHMGSALVGDAVAMSVILGVLAERNLFFVDSRTSADTLGYTLARRLGLPSAERQVFLDNERDPDKIRGQFRHLLELAHQRGGAVAIAHPYPETLMALRAEIPGALTGGVEFVTVSALLDG